MKIKRECLTSEEGTSAFFSSPIARYNVMHYIIFCILQVTIDSAVEKAASVLKSGGVVGLPTDTIYGIAASVSSDEAISKLYSIKGRQKNKPIAICVSDVQDINK